MCLFKFEPLRLGPVEGCYSCLIVVQLYLVLFKNFTGYLQPEPLAVAAGIHGVVEVLESGDVAGEVT